MILVRRFGCNPRFAAPAAILVAAFVAGILTGATVAGGFSVPPTSPRAVALPPHAAVPVTQGAVLARPATPATDGTGSRYPVEVLRIVDGDTFEARVRAWPGLEITTKVRLRNIDAPEMRARCEREAAMARAARNALGDMLGDGRVAIMRVGLDKYGGRVLADASARNIPDVALALLEAGLVRRYAGGRRESWC